MQKNVIYCNCGIHNGVEVIQMFIKSSQEDKDYNHFFNDLENLRKTLNEEDKKFLEENSNIRQKELVPMQSFLKSTTTKCTTYSLSEDVPEILRAFLV